MTIANATWFYHEHGRRLVGAFAQLFSGMTVVRRNPDGSVRELIWDVPIENFVHDKFYERAKIQKADDGELGSKGHQVFPRMTYGMTGMTYDGRRQQAVLNRFLAPIDDNKTRVTVAPAPWTYEFELKIAARNFSDMMQLVEQIVIHFRPSHTIVLRDIPFNSHIDVPLFLDSMQWTDSAEDDLEEGSRQLIATLGFHAEYQLYGPTGSAAEIAVKHMMDDADGVARSDPKGIGKLINKTIIDVYSIEENFPDSSGSDARYTFSQTSQSSPLVIDLQTPPTEGRES